MVFPLSILALTSCVGRQDVRPEDRILEFGCGDTVVVARAMNQSVEPVKDENGEVWEGWVTATLSVQRVIRGARVPHRLPIRYFAHTYMRDDVDFMMVLRRNASGTFEVQTGQIMPLRPRLAARCN